MTAETIQTEAFTASRARKCRWDETKGYEWSIAFVPNGIWKSRACRIAEENGVRYASHRKGYRASERAMKRFLENLSAA